MEQRGVKKQPGRRSDRTSGDSPEVAPTFAEAMSDLGIPEKTARDHLKAHDDYEASAPEFKKKVDAGEMTAKKARQATRRVRRG